MNEHVKFIFSCYQCIETCRWRYIASQPNIQCTMPFMNVPGWQECATSETAMAAIKAYRHDS